MFATEHEVLATPQELFEFGEQFFADLMDTVRRKNNDYSGAGVDALANFTSIEKKGIPALVGMLTRMEDKMMRLGTFVGGKDFQVMGESASDTLLDLASYAMLMAAMIKFKQRLIEKKATAKYHLQDLEQNAEQMRKQAGAMFGSMANMVDTAATALKDRTLKRQAKEMAFDPTEKPAAKRSSVRKPAPKKKAATKRRR